MAIYNLDVVILPQRYACKEHGAVMLRLALPRLADRIYFSTSLTDKSVIIFIP